MQFSFWPFFGAKILLEIKNGFFRSKLDLLALHKFYASFSLPSVFLQLHLHILVCGFSLVKTLLTVFPIGVSLLVEKKSSTQQKLTTKCKAKSKVPKQFHSKLLFFLWPWKKFTVWCFKWNVSLITTLDLIDDDDTFF